MKSYLYRCLVLFIAFSWAGATSTKAQTAPVACVPIRVDSSAFIFSPGNWTGDQGREGSVYRQTWNPGAYFRVYWFSNAANPTATLQFDTSVNDASHPAPTLILNIDELWTEHVPCATEVQVPRLAGAGKHTLTVYFSSSEQRDRGGTAQSGGRTIIRVTGHHVDADAKVRTVVTGKAPPWALMVGDSITEGIAADNGRSDNLSDYSYLVGQALQTQGMEYGVSACGWSVWLNPGDNPPSLLRGRGLDKRSRAEPTMTATAAGINSTAFMLCSIAKGI